MLQAGKMLGRSFGPYNRVISQFTKTSPFWTIWTQFTKWLSWRDSQSKRTLLRFSPTTDSMKQLSKKKKYNLTLCTGKPKSSIPQFSKTLRPNWATHSLSSILGSKNSLTWKQFQNKLSRKWSLNMKRIRQIQMLPILLPLSLSQKVLPQIKNNGGLKQTRKMIKTKRKGHIFK